MIIYIIIKIIFFFQAEDGIRDPLVTGVQTCALPILICQPPGHPTDRHYHLTDEWWVVLEGEIDWEIEGQPAPVHARAGDLVLVPANHFHHIRPTGRGPSIRLAITPPGEFHRHEREPGAGPY